MNRRLRTLLTTAALTAALTWQPAMAVPAWRGPITTRQPDGTMLTYYMTGDEFGHQCYLPDGTPVVQDTAGWFRPGRAQRLDAAIAQHSLQRKTPQASRWQVFGFPTKGEVKCLVILAEFNDLHFTFGHDFHERMMNELGFSDDGATGSATDYFTEQSMQTFFPKFDVVGPVRLSKNYAVYGENDFFTGSDAGTGRMIQEACWLAHDDYGVNFADYDNNNDGEVDMVYVVYAGYGEASGAGSNYVWPKKWQLAAENLTCNIDGKKIDVYACSAELYGNPAWEEENGGHHSAGIGTVCHEFGHVLGFADHYSTAETVYRLGSYDIMDYGPYNNQGHTPPAYNAFERISLGWMTPDTLVTNPQSNIELEHIATSNRAYVLTTGNRDECYFIEARQQEGWDRYLPSAGLMITHLEFDAISWAYNTVNTDGSHQRFYLVCADNDPAYDYQTGRDTERGDLYPSATTGNKEFTDQSRPAANPYTGEVLDKWVTNIRNVDGTVLFDYMNNHLEMPANVRVTSVGDTEFTLQWDAVDRADRYEANLYRLIHESEMPVALAEGFCTMQTGTLSQPDGTNIADQLDDYTCMAGWTGEYVYQAGGLCKIGSAGVSGRLTTPQLNLSTGDGAFGVCVKVQSVQGKTPVFSITSNGQTARVRISSSAREYYAQFQGGLAKSTIDFGSVSERAFIDTIVVVRGTQGAELFPQAKVVSVSGDVAQTVGDDVPDNLVVADTTVVTGIATNSHTFSGLQRGVNYCVELRAMNNDMGSAYTTLIYVLTGSQEQGINDVEQSMPFSVRRVYDLQGRQRMSGQMPKGILIEQRGTQSRIRPHRNQGLWVQ